MGDVDGQLREAAQVSEPYTPERFVTDCRACVDRGGSADDIAALVKRGLDAQIGHPALWGGEVLLLRMPDLMIVDLTLAPQAASPVHDHATWAVIGVSSGCEIEQFHSRTATGLVPSRRVELRRGDTLVLSPDDIHSIENPLAEPMRGLHVYGRDITCAPRRMWDPETGAECAFDGKTFERWSEALSGGPPVPASARR